MNIEQVREYILSLSGVTEDQPFGNVELWMMRSDGGMLRLMAKLFGGQGTNNTNSWAPDSRHVAFVSYRTSSIR